MMRIALGHIDSYDDRVARFAHQLGLPTVQLHTPDNLKGEPGYWETTSCKRSRTGAARMSFRWRGWKRCPCRSFLESAA